MKPKKTFMSYLLSNTVEIYRNFMCKEKIIYLIFFTYAFLNLFAIT